MEQGNGKIYKRRHPADMQGKAGAVYPPSVYGYLWHPEKCGNYDETAGKGPES